MKKLLKVIKKMIMPILLETNDHYNHFLEELLLHSFKTRQSLYAEGGPERPSNDRDISIYYRWKLLGDIYWNSQCAFSIFSMQGFGEKTIIELACANGWFYREFYYWYDDVTYYGYDLNQYTIGEARRKLKYKEKKCKRKAKANFEVKNILNDEEIYSVDATHVFFYATLCMFSKEDRRKIIFNISKSLKVKKGIFCGNGGVVLENSKQWDMFIGLYDTEEELYNELKMFFNNVYIMPRDKNSETVYFMASDGELTFYNK